MKTCNKPIALFVVLAFLSLLQLSVMPLRAHPATAAAETTVSGAEQGPGVIEEEGSAASPSRKKSILPIIIGVAAVGAVVVALLVLKTKYEIAGTWTIHITYDDDDYAFDSITTFSGDRSSGTTSDNYSGTGSYSVDGKKVTFTLTWPNGNTSTFTGQFDEKNKMSGRFHESFDWDGDWTAVRGGSAAATPGKMSPARHQGAGR